MSECLEAKNSTTRVGQIRCMDFEGPATEGNKEKLGHILARDTNGHGISILGAKHEITEKNHRAQVAA